MIVAFLLLFLFVLSLFGGRSSSPTGSSLFSGVVAEASRFAVTPSADLVQLREAFVCNGKFLEVIFYGPEKL